MPHLRKEMACVLKKRPEEKSSGLLKFRPAALTNWAHLTAFGDDRSAAYAKVHRISHFHFPFAEAKPSTKLSKFKNCQDKLL